MSVYLVTGAAGFIGANYVRSREAAELALAEALRLLPKAAYPKTLCCYSAAGKRPTRQRRSGNRQDMHHRSSEAGHQRT